MHGGEVQQSQLLATASTKSLIPEGTFKPTVIVIAANAAAVIQLA